MPFDLGAPQAIDGDNGNIGNLADLLGPSGAVGDFHPPPLRDDADADPFGLGAAGAIGSFSPEEPPIADKSDIDPMALSLSRLHDSRVLRFSDKSKCSDRTADEGHIDRWKSRSAKRTMGSKETV